MRSGLDPLANASLRRPVNVRLWFAVEALLAGLTFLVMSTLHFGLHLGPLTDHPLRIGAFVEGGCGIVLVGAGLALTVSPRRSWPLEVGAHCLCILALLLGIVATRSGTSELNFVYHRVMLVGLAIGLLALLAGPGRALRALA